MSSCCQGGCQGGFEGNNCNDLIDHNHCHHGHHNHHRCCPDLFKRPLVLTSTIPRNGQTGVSPNIKSIKLIFSRDFNNDRRLINIENDIELWQGSNKIPIRIKRSASRHDGHCVILVIPLMPLLGGVTYKLRIRSTFIRLEHREDDRCGRRNREEDTFTRCRLIVFSTRCR